MKYLSQAGFAIPSNADAHRPIGVASLSQTESFRAGREALLIRLRDQEKLTFQQIGDRFDRSACRAAQICQAARRKIQFPPTVNPIGSIAY
jgi:predicted DNA-binding protein (UPF0251 family)